MRLEGALRIACGRGGMGSVLEVTSLSNARVKGIAALALKKERAASGLFVVEGLQLVGFGIEAGWELDTLVVLKGTHHDVLDRAVQAAGSVLEVNDAVMEKLSRKENPQGVLGVFKQHTLALKRLSVDGLWVVLEQVRDPGNLGTIIRTADAVGAQGVMLLGDCTDVWAPECVRATMGSIFHVPLVKTSVKDFMEWKAAKGDGVMLVGTHLQGAVDYREVQVQRPLMLCMGTEQSGLTKAMAEACDVKVKIPMRGRAESLNLAMATGIMLYELTRQVP